MHAEDRDLIRHDTIVDIESAPVVGFLEGGLFEIGNSRATVGIRSKRQHLRLAFGASSRVPPRLDRKGPVTVDSLNRPR